MKHYGDICKMNGAEIERVECVIGGSPCQDLSVAGKRAGLAGERSGLFMEQIRIIKEMRERDRKDGRTGVDVFPRFMVWENVYGAFSSNGGEDFRAVLEEVAKVADKSAAIPRYEGGAWKPSGVIMGDGWSIAWRTHDAQHWGVPQRRRRISLVADFNGQTAPWITFDCVWRETDLRGQDAADGCFGGESGPEVQFITESLSGYSEPCGTERKAAAGCSAGGIRETGGAMNPWDPQSERVYGADGVWHSLNANESGGQSRDAVCYGFKLGQGEKAHGMAFEKEKSPTLNAECGGNKPAVLCGVDLYNQTITDEVAATLGASSGNANTAGPKVLVFAQNQRDEVRNLNDCAGSLAAEPGMKQQTYVMSFSQNGSGAVVVGENSYSLSTRQNPCGRGTGMILDARNRQERSVICIQGNCIDRADNAGCNGKGWNDEDVSYTLNTIDRPAVFDGTRRHDYQEFGEVAGTVRAQFGTGGNNTPIVVYDARGNGDGETVCTITGDHQNRVTDYTAICVGNGQADNTKLHEMAPALSCMHDQQAVMVMAVDCRNGRETEVNGTLQAKENGGTSLNLDNVCREGAMVRRLTPLECERLQGYPDGWVFIGDWTDEKGKIHKQADAPMYKALGNSIALPFWYWLLERISGYCTEKTMGSLFSGIGGFDLCWQMINGDESVRFSSEIEPFCIAVMKKRFGDEERGIKGDWMDYVRLGGNET